VPIYEYECGRCGVFEQSQRITEPALTKCPTCRRKVRRLISNTSFQLKGSGWDVTDYARKGGEKKGTDGDAAKAETKSDGASASTGDSTAGKSDTKSGTKSDSTAGTGTPAKTAS